MEIKKLAIGFIIVIIILFFLVAPIEDNKKISEQNSTIEIKDIRRFGDFAYIETTNNVTGEILIITSNKPLNNNIYILRERGLGYENFDSFATDIQKFENYGYKVKIIDPFFIPEDGVLVVPTGGMPKHILDNIDRYNNTKIFYIGRKDLIIDGEIKSETWYNENYSKILLEENDLTDYPRISELISNRILESTWGEGQKTVVSINKTNAAYSNISNKTYIRIVYSSEKGAKNIIDKELPEQKLKLEYKSIFIGEEAVYEFSINKTNGSAYISLQNIEKINEKLGRVIEENYFSKRFVLEKGGDYTVNVSDDSNTIGGTVLHVKEVEVSLANVQGNQIYIDAKIDGEEIKSDHITAWIENSTQRRNYTINNGKIIIAAKLKNGQNILNLEYNRKVFRVEISNQKEDLADIYLKYGIPGLFLVVVVFLWARMIKRPIYRIKITDAPIEIRKEVAISSKEILILFEKAKDDLHLDGPLTVDEISVLMIRYVTNGADISEGNIEEILKKMEKNGLIFSYNGYYGKNTNIKEGVLRRKIKDKLIEKGISFQVSNRIFTTKNYEIGLIGDKFSKRAFIVFEDKQEKSDELGKLGKKKLAEMEIKQFNKNIELVTIQELEDLL